MAKFAFEAKAFNGKDMRGEIEAANEAEARVKLRAQKLVPIRVVQQGNKTMTKGGVTIRSTAKVKSQDLQVFTRQLSTLLSSGVPILQAIDTLAQGGRSPGLTNALKIISAEVSKGKRLAESLGEHPGVFNKFYVNMVRAGEESGALDAVLSRLSLYIEKSVKLQGKVKGAMVYPMVIMVIAAVVVAALLIFVIPKFQSLFAQSGNELPALTKVVVAMSDAFIAYWYIIIGSLVGGIWGFMVWYATPLGRQTCDVFAIDLPLVGDLIKKNGVARFSRTLSTLLASGVSIIDAMDIASKTVGNFMIERAVIRAKDSIAEGKSLTVPLTKEKYIPHMVVQMIGVGEQTGTLDQMLSRIADFYEDEVDVAVGALTTVIEPMMMVVLGIIIAFLVVAMYLPIFNMAGAAGG